MVFLKVKISENDQFIYETKTNILIGEFLPELINIYNTRIRLRHLISECRELVKYGVAKPPEERGLSDEVAKLSINSDDESDKQVQQTNKENQKPINKDPTERRVGIPPEEQFVSMINKELDAAELLISKDQAEKRICITMKQLKEAIERIDGAIKIAYVSTEGLPKHDPIVELLSDDFTHNDMLDPKTACLWFAGKELYRDKKLMDTKSIGTNEKTMIIAKLTKQGSGPPVREPVVSSELQKKLMAHYYKKQEEHKKLMECDDDSYVNSEWANPKGMQSYFQGLSKNITWKPKF